MAKRGDAAAVRALLATGADVHARLCGGFTALYLAARGGYCDVVC